MTDLVTQYIPQRHPIVMIDKIQYADELKAVTTFLVTQENLFVEEGMLKEPGLIENIAQTAAAQVGFICKQTNSPVPIGYIAAIRYLSINQLPPVGSEITTSIIRKNQIMDIILIEGTASIGDTAVCSCEMRVFVKSDNS